MACDTRYLAGETPEVAKKRVNAALERLEEALAAGSVTVKVGANGGITFAGWNDKNGVSDACAFRRLQQNSSEFRRQLARAEGLAGRKADARVIASGTHSHDGGKSWHDGH